MSEAVPQPVTSAPPTPAAGAARTASGETRTGSIQTDRPCSACGFNLHGQPTVRERHYAMLITRCPECGVVAALQEYPSLGRWAGRWAGLIAGVWFLVLIVGVFATGAVMMALASSVRSDAVEPLAIQIATEHKAAQTAALTASAAGTAATTAGGATGNANLNWYASQEPGKYNSIEIAWWEKQDAGALLARAMASEKGSLQWWALWNWRAIPLIFVPLGCFWAAALVAVPRRRVWVIAIPAVGAAAFIQVFADADSAVATWMIHTTAATLAAKLTGGMFFWLTLAAAAVTLGVSALIGRPIVRWMVRWLLPPGACAALGILWTCDGIDAPGRNR